MGICTDVLRLFVREVLRRAIRGLVWGILPAVTASTANSSAATGSASASWSRIARIYCLLISFGAISKVNLVWAWGDLMNVLQCPQPGRRHRHERPGGQSAVRPTGG